MSRHPDAAAARRAGGVGTMLAVLAASVVLALLAVEDYLLALAAVAGLGGFGLFVYRPFVGVCVLLATIPLENVGMPAQGLTISRLVGFGVLAGWVVHKGVRRESLRPLLNSGLFVVSALFIAFVALSALWAREPRYAISGAVQLVRLFGLSLILYDLVRTWDRAEWVVRILVLAGLLAAALTIQQYYGGGARRAGDDVAGGVNSTATLLVTTLPLAFYMFRSRQATGWRLLGGVFFAASVIAIAVTFSRFNMLLLPVVLATLYWITLRGRRGSFWLAVMTAVGVLLAASFLPWQRIVDRAETIGPYLEGAIEQEGGESSRGYHLRLGLEIAKDHPLVGVGYDNYGDYFLYDYQYTVEGAGRMYTSHRSPHSSFVGIVADLGAIGLLLWIGLLGFGALRGLQAWRSTREREGNHDRHFLVQSLLIAFLLQAGAYGLYLPVQKQKIFWVLLPMVFVARCLSEQLTGGEEKKTSPSVAPGLGRWRGRVPAPSHRSAGT